VIIAAPVGKVGAGVTANALDLGQIGRTGTTGGIGEAIKLGTIRADAASMRTGSSRWRASFPSP
jgi:uridine phosphorylase